MFYDLLERPSPEYLTYKDLLHHGQETEIAQSGFTILRTGTNASEYFQMVLAEKPV